MKTIKNVLLYIAGLTVGIVGLALYYLSILLLLHYIFSL